MTTSPGQYEGLLDDLRAPTRSLRDRLPDTWGAPTWSSLAPRSTTPRGEA